MQSILFAVGEGTYITGSAVFFTQIVGLSAAQVGVGLTVAGVVSFFAVPAGKLAGATALLCLVWPLISGFGSFLAMLATGRDAVVRGVPLLTGLLLAANTWWIVRLPDPPALFTWLAMEHGSLGWMTIAALVILATLTMGPTARAAERYLAQHGSAG